MEELQLKGRMFKVLASDTRREILKKLAVRPMTVSELSRSLKINKSAVFNHLDILAKAELLYKRNMKNEFIYYILTDEGEALVTTNKKIKLFLVSSAISLVGGFAGLLTYLAKKAVPPEEIRPYPPTLLSFQVLKELPYELIIGISLILLSLVLLYHATILRRRYAFKS